MRIKIWHTHGNTVEEVVAVFLAVLEDADILEDLLVDRDPIVIADRVLAQEVKDNVVRRLESDVFATQGTAADSVRLVFAFFVTRTKG